MILSVFGIADPEKVFDILPDKHLDNNYRKLSDSYFEYYLEEDAKLDDLRRLIEFREDPSIPVGFEVIL